MAPVSLSGISRRPHKGRQRRCLLKGCGQWFVPSHPQCRYCSAACRQAARCWRRWRSQQKYRSSTNGRQQRQEQARRYRQRCGQRPPPVTGPGSGDDVPPADTDPAAGPAATADANTRVREGKRAAPKSATEALGCCDRPGCYEIFAIGASGSPRRFCCALCRKALQCVLQREARRRRRRHRGLQRPGRRPRPRIRGP